MTIRSAALALLVLATPVAAQDLATELSGPEVFSDIEDDASRAAALFDEMAKVITHPRCLNCHPVDNIPRQGDDMALHQPHVVRGEDDHGAVGMECTTCHSTENVAYTGAEGSIPGHDPWHLAPLSTGWIGLSNAEICAQLKDPERNGDRTLAEILEHNAEDGLVGWAWHPGEGRTPAPGSQEIFGDLTEAWIEAGASCPS
ncbi:Isoquinoline 1-oxidoreductase subunit [Roseobacter sp. HKCCA0434]|uniref:Isoquinoline 1-oxidoreductase subunit n=1 Tax=Roseobacter sp. HKCCA0434 TaxID=3079297 RepID=UPI002905C87D|nr:Isoquinoline 1-oxidoreductase subunit [Roseobacter sp. HKCCA0434]